MYTPSEGFNSFNHKTELLWKSQTEIKRVAIVACHIKDDYIGHSGIDWKTRVNKGCYSFLALSEYPKQVITLFVDFDNRLAKKFELNIHPDPFVVAVDFSMLTDFEKNTLRDELTKQFTHYMDPRKGNPKVSLTPIYEHCYDIIFLERGNCEGHRDTYEQILTQINIAVEKNQYDEEYEVKGKEKL